MNDFLKVYCQESYCPYGKKDNQRCLLCEISKCELPQTSQHQRYKCRRAKKDGPLQLVIVELPVA